MDNLIEKLRNEVNNLLNQFTIKDISHDISHLDRVYKMALFIVYFYYRLRQTGSLK